MSTQKNNSSAKKNDSKKGTGKSISLGIKDRLSIAGILPRESDLLTQILVRDIIEKTKITQDEMEEIHFERIGDRLKWDNESAVDLDVEFSTAESKILIDSINRLNSQKKVTQELLDLCMKIKTLE